MRDRSAEKCVHEGSAEKCVHEGSGAVMYSIQYKIIADCFQLKPL